MHQLTEKEKLDFGIEIVAAMKASVFDATIEDGRIMALQDTEIDRVALDDGMDFEDLDDESKKFIERLVKCEKERLHKQASYVAEIALEYLKTNVSCTSK